MKNYALLFCFLLMTVLLFGQNKEREYRQKLSEKAAEFYKEYNFVKAIEIYKELDKLGSTVAPRKLGDCYRQMNDPVNAEVYYERTVQQQNINAEYYFYYAQALMSNNKYEAAKQWFETYKSKEENSTKADVLIEACEKAIHRIDENSAYHLLNLDINSSAQDFAPYFFDKGILFTSSRIESFIRKKDAWTNTGYLDVYYAPLNWRDTIPGVSKIKGSVNTFNFHDGPACVNKDGSRIYFTRNNVVDGSAKESRSGDIKLKIFSAERSGDSFKDVKELAFNGDEYSTAHPSVSFDEQIIYFTSDRAGGYGGTDIYYSTYDKQKSKWNRAENLGPVINTEGNERFPFIHESGTLYFASDGHLGFGGLDIFEAIPNDSLPNTFDEVNNLGAPFNTSRDDFSYIIDQNKITGYFASNREGGKGNDDIYQFTSATIPIDVKTAINDTAIASAMITIYDIDKRITLDNNYTDVKGNFYSRLQPNSNYMISVKKKGFETIQKPIQTTSVENPVKFIIEMKRMAKERYLE
ncbi:MAG: hypothetical protein R2730_06520 [Chitinophagales bacterium]